MRIALTALLASAFVAPAARAAEPAERGKTLFEACAVCHAFEPVPDEVGPHLKGVIGRAAGSLEGFPFSPAMKRSGLVWSAQTLDRFLADPQGAVPGNRMPFAGMEPAADRAALIAYIEAAGR